MTVDLIMDYQQISFWVVDVTSHVYDPYSYGLMFFWVQAISDNDLHMYFGEDWKSSLNLLQAVLHHLITAASLPPLDNFVFPV
jgi:hypothetical protein